MHSFVTLNCQVLKIVLGTVLAVIAPCMPAGNNADITRTTCIADEHTHRCADLRIRAVRVERVSDCGFEYTDLEDNSIGLPNGTDHRLDYSKKFELARLTGDHLEWRDRKAVRTGMLGMAIYCSHPGCGRVLILQLIKPELFSANSR